MKIRYRGFKKRSGEYDLGRAALLQGDIGTGKSALIAAIHFGLAGKVASMRMGKGDTQDPGRLLKLAEDGATVEIELNTHRVTRVLKATEKKAKVVTIVGTDSGPQAEAAAAKLAGDLIYADFGRLVSAGDTERAQILATYLPQPEDKEKRWWAIAQAMCHMEAALKPPAKKGKANEPDVAGRMSKDDATNLRERLVKMAEVMKCSEAMTAAFAVFKKPDASAEEILEALRDAANKAEQDRQTSLKVAMEATNSGGAAVEVAADVPALEAQLSVLMATARDQEKAKGDHARYLASIDGYLTRIARLTSKINELETQVTSIEAANAAAHAAREALETHKRVEPTRPDLGAMRGLEVNVAGLQQAIRDAQRGRDAMTTWTLQLQTFEHEYADVEACEPTRPECSPEMYDAEIAAVNAQIETERNEGRPVRQRWEAAQTGVCPVMCRACPAPEDLVEFAAGAEEVLNQKMARVEALLDNLRALQTARADAVEQEANFRAQISDWERRKAAVLGKIQHANEQRSDAERAAKDVAQVETEYTMRLRELEMLRQAQEGYQSAFQRWADQRAKLHEQHVAAESLVAKLTQALDAFTEASNERTRLAMELDQLRADPVPPPGDAEDLTVDIEMLQRRVEAAHAARARDTLLAEINVDGKSMAATVLKAAHKGAAAGVIGSIQAATAPIVDRITSSLHRMGIDGTFIVDLEAKMFGVHKDGVDIDVETLSGGEKVLFAAAMLSALPPKGGTRVLTLESAELPGKWLTRLMAGLDIEAFDAVVLASCHRAQSIPAGWAVVDMGERSDG